MGAERFSISSGPARTGATLGLVMALLVGLTAWLIDRASTLTAQSPGVTSALETPLSRQAAQLIEPVFMADGASVSARRTTDGHLAILIATPGAEDTQKLQQARRLLAFGLDFDTAAGDRLSLETSPAAEPRHTLLAYGPAGLSGLAALILFLAWQSARRPAPAMEAPKAPPVPSPEPANDVTGEVVVKIREWMAEHPRT